MCALRGQLHMRLLPFFSIARVDLHVPQRQSRPRHELHRRIKILYLMQLEPSTLSRAEKTRSVEGVRRAYGACALHPPREEALVVDVLSPQPRMQ